MITKIIHSLIISFLLIVFLGCSFLPFSFTNNIGGSFHPLDYKSVEFISKNVDINMSKYGKQEERIGNQLLTNTEFLIATSGGGQRAAAFTMGVLVELESLGNSIKEKKHFNALTNVDYFSSVSGGAWASGAYIKFLIEYNKDNNNSTFSLKDNLEDIETSIRALEMSIFSNNCLIEKIDEKITSSIKFNDIFVDNTKKPKVPYIFYNATIASTHAPFVFNQDYIEHYRINQFNYCGESVTINQDINELPLSVAIGTSSSVPGFRFTQAHTEICEEPDMKTAYICQKIPPSKNTIDVYSELNLDHKHLNQNPEYMHLFDGGVYDNLGYKTGIEVMNGLLKTSNKVMLVIDANADTYLPFTESKSSEWGMLIDTGIKASLAANATTSQKVLEKVSEAFGIKTIVLSFASLSGYIDKAKKFEKLSGFNDGNLTKDLYSLNKFLEIDSENDKVLCNYENIDNNFSKNDCENNKYFRVGLSSVTSHAIGDRYYRAVQDLGRLVVRLNAHDIYTKLKKK